MVRSPLSTPICPYCHKLVTGGKVVLLPRGGYAHATCKTAHEQQVRDEREQEKLGRRLTEKLDAVKTHEDMARFFSGLKGEKK